MPTLTKLKFWKVRAEAVPPKFATQGAACFDLCVCITDDMVIPMRGGQIFDGVPLSASWEAQVEPKDGQVTICPGQRALIPTGVILDIPTGYSVRLHPRSGLAWNHGIMLANCEGVVDSDYVHEVKVILLNNGSSPFTIKHGDRLCQAEMVEDTRYEFMEASEKPTQKTDRVGGFGSTGVSNAG